jgi:peptidyl-prolyl cis-trans isomerase B (cyclophilin B)
MRFLIFAILIVGLVLILGCVNNPEDKESETIDETIDADTGEQAASFLDEDKIIIEDKKEDEVEYMGENPIVVFETDKGELKAEVFLDEAPITSKNFLKLVRKGFYDGLTFHRVEPNFVVQGGDPKGDGTGGSDEKIPLEVKPELKHELGSLAMARSTDPNSASSQFYFVIGDGQNPNKPASFLDMNYAVFGKVQGDGLDSVVRELTIGDKMNKVYIEGE